VRRFHGAVVGLFVVLIGHKKYLINTVRYKSSPQEGGMGAECPPSSISFFVEHAEQVESKETQENADDK
jgi:hypothetical protein